ncbi:MAG: hypothetical protein NTW69_07995 [Chloroflexi bacterium]|jgi:hypothetical protein|nr:hypothetical protein [Chloroflexota bacterium]
MEEFERHLDAVCSKLSFVKSITIFSSTESSNLWRITLSDDTFVDVYYSEITGKTSFAHIMGSKRILGADNAGGWHWHPSKAPDSHISSETEITIEEFMEELESTFK